MELKRIIGQCAPLFFLALIFDLVGFILLLVGLSAAPQIGGRCYGDFLALTGAVLMVIGLGMWVMWYAGNLGVDGKRIDFRRMTRRLTQRLSSVRGKTGGMNTEEEEDEEEDGGKNEKNGAYINEAYEPADNETA